MKNLLVAQSGGPTSAINATLAGVIENALSSPSVDKIYGSVNGIQGVLNENLIDLKTKITNVSELDLLCQTPASALGSCRVKLKDPRSGLWAFTSWHPIPSAPPWLSSDEPCPCVPFCRACWRSRTMRRCSVSAFVLPLPWQLL